jgi:type II secretory pathway component PulF
MKTPYWKTERKWYTRIRRSFWFAFLRMNISRDRKQYVMDNLSIQLISGLDLFQAIEAITEDINSWALRKLLRTMAEDVLSGIPFWESLSESGLFSPHIVSLIRIGEESGKLAENLQVIADEQDKERVFQSRIRSALLYPVFVLSLTVIIALGIAWFILPNIITVFEQINIPLPLPTRILVRVGNFFADYGSIAVPAIAVGIIVFVYVFFGNRHTRFLGQRLLFTVPGIRRLMQQLEIGRMGYVLGSLLGAGLPIVEAIRSLADATSLGMYKRFYMQLADRVENGESFQVIFQSRRRLRVLIPRTIQQIIITGEQSGHLSESLRKIGQIYETKTETSTKNIAVILEPILLVIVWVGVVTVALSVVLPIYSLIGGLNAGTL